MISMRTFVVTEQFRNRLTNCEMLTFVLALENLLGNTNGVSALKCLHIGILNSLFWTP